MLKRTTEIQNALTVLTSELHQLRALMSEPVQPHTPMSSEPAAREPARPASGQMPEILDQPPQIREPAPPSREPVRAPNVPASSPRDVPLPARPAQGAPVAQPRTAAANPTSARALQEQQAPARRPRSPVNQGEDLASLLERSAWDEADQAMAYPEEPLEFDEPPPMDFSQGAGRAAPPFEGFETTSHAPSAVPPPVQRPADHKPRPQPAQDPGAVPLPARPIASDDPKKQSQIPEVRTRPPGAWSPAPERERKSRSSIRLQPHEDLAAMLERGDWSKDSTPHESGSTGDMPQHRPRSDSRPQTRTSKDGLEALLTGYLDEDEK